MKLKVKEFSKQENKFAKVVFSAIIVAAFFLVFSPAVADFLRLTGSTGWGYGYGYGYGWGYGWDGGTVAGYRTEASIGTAAGADNIYGWGYSNLAVAPVGGVYTITSASIATLYTTGLITASGSNPAVVSSIKFNDDVTVTASASAGTISVAIPNGAILTKTGGGDFNFAAMASSDQTAAAAGAISGGTVRGALKFGTSVGLTSSADVTINIPVGASYDGVGMRINQSETSATTGYAAASTPTCTIGAVTSGFCTFTTRTFSYFAVSQTSSGSGGGSNTGDTTAPTGTITINSGAASTTSRTVTLNFTANDSGGSVPIMGISNTSDFTNVSWEAYTSSKTWTLTEGNGVKTVYIKFKDSSSNTSAAYSDTITLTSQATEQVEVPVVPVEPVVPPVVIDPVTGFRTQTPAVLSSSEVARRVNLMAGTYNWQLINQSAYPATLAPNAETTVWIEVKNTGTAHWFDNGEHIVRLGSGSSYGNANQQRDYGSEFSNPTWYSANRPAIIMHPEIEPGWHTRFSFTIKAPATAGVYKAYFTPVVDGIEWMNDIGLYWQITVQ